MLQLPQRGQPIAYSDLSNMVTKINDLDSKLSIKTTNFLAKNGTTSSQNISGLAFAAVYKEITNSTEKVNASTAKEFTVNFGTAFKVPPIVTITPQSINGTISAKSAIVVITAITTTSVTGVVRFIDVSTAVSVGVNVIAVGIPN